VPRILNFFILMITLLFCASCFQSPVPQGFNPGKRSNGGILTLKPIAPRADCGYAYNGDEKDFQVIKYGKPVIHADVDTQQLYAAEDIKLKKLRPAADKALFHSIKELHTDKVVLGDSYDVQFSQEEENLHTDLTGLENNREFDLTLEYHGPTLENCSEKLQ
jgi:hypothetical protein